MVTGVALSAEIRSSNATMMKLATSEEPPYDTNGSVTPVRGITRRDPADDHERLDADDRGEAGREELRERPVGLHRDAVAAAAQQEDRAR